MLFRDVVVDTERFNACRCFRPRAIIVKWSKQNCGLRSLELIPDELIFVPDKRSCFIERSVELQGWKNIYGFRTEPCPIASVYWYQHVLYM